MVGRDSISWNWGHTFSVFQIAVRCLRFYAKIFLIQLQDLIFALFLFSKSKRCYLFSGIGARQCWASLARQAWPATEQGQSFHFWPDSLLEVELLSCFFRRNSILHFSVELLNCFFLLNTCHSFHKVEMENQEVPRNILRCQVPVLKFRVIRIFYSIWVRRVGCRSRQRELLCFLLEDAPKWR